MASEIDIANLALSRLGDDATVASLYPSEGSAQAEHAARWYPIARDALIEAHDWHFATRRATLAALEGTWTPWSYAYATPSDTIRVIAVLPADGADSDVQPFEREIGPSWETIILTDQENARIRYVARVTDPTRFSPLFVDALAWLLASHLAGPLIKGDTGMKMAAQCAQASQTLLSRAATSDANQRHSDPRASHAAPWIAGR